MNSGIIVGVVLALLAYSECYKTLLAIGILGTIACLLLYVNQNKILYMPGMY